MRVAHAAVHASMVCGGSIREAHLPVEWEVMQLEGLIEGATHVVDEEDVVAIGRRSELLLKDNDIARVHHFKPLKVPRRVGAHPFAWRHDIR